MHILIIQDHMSCHSHHGITAFSCNMTCVLLISALDVTPPDCWLNKHKMGGTSGVSKSKSDWLDSTGNKAVVTSNPSKEKESCCDNCNNDRLSGPKCWIFKCM